MDIGLGLFLGLCFCGLIYLYTQTKDRWNWAKARKAFLVTLWALILLGGISIGGILSYQYYQGLPRVITEIQGLKLGDTRSDAVFKLGEPERLSVVSPDGGEETVSFRSHSVSATLRSHKVVSVTYSCKSNERNHTSLNGIHCGDRGEKILKNFDGNVRVLCHIVAKEQGPWTEYQRLSRAYDVVKYGTRYQLIQN